MRMGPLHLTGERGWACDSSHCRVSSQSISSGREPCQKNPRSGLALPGSFFGPMRRKPSISPPTTIASPAIPTPLKLKTPDGKRSNAYVDPQKFKQSVHGRMFACVDCHAE